MVPARAGGGGGRLRAALLPVLSMETLCQALSGSHSQVCAASSCLSPPAADAVGTNPRWPGVLVTVTGPTGSEADTTERAPVEHSFATRRPPLKRVCARVCVCTDTHAHRRAADPEWVWKLLRLTEAIDSGRNPVWPNYKNLEALGDPGVRLTVKNQECRRAIPGVRALPFTPEPRWPSRQVAGGLRHLPPQSHPLTPRWLTLLQTLDLPGRGWGCREALPQPPPGKCT